jgi:uncharacterized damage-inducible protein DinB
MSRNSREVMTMNELRPAALLLAFLMLLGVLSPQSTAQDNKSKQPPTPSQVILEAGSDVGNRIIAMAEDWSEGEYGYRPNDQVRTFQQVLLHVAGSNYGLVNSLRGQKLGNQDNDPSTDVYKTKAQVVDFLRKSIAEGDATIKQESDAGFLKHLRGWVDYTEHMGEHYGLLVAYCRNNGIVPLESRSRH